MWVPTALISCITLFVTCGALSVQVIGSYQAELRESRAEMASRHKEFRDDFKEWKRQGEISFREFTDRFEDFNQSHAAKAASWEATAGAHEAQLERTSDLVRQAESTISALEQMTLDIARSQLVREFEEIRIQMPDSMPAGERAAVVARIGSAIEFLHRYRHVLVDEFASFDSLFTACQRYFTSIATDDKSVLADAAARIHAATDVVDKSLNSTTESKEMAAYLRFAHGNILMKLGGPTFLEMARKKFQEAIGIDRSGDSRFLVNYAIASLQLANSVEDPSRREELLEIAHDNMASALRVPCSDRTRRICDVNNLCEILLCKAENDSIEHRFAVVEANRRLAPYMTLDHDVAAVFVTAAESACMRLRFGLFDNDLQKEELQQFVLEAIARACEKGYQFGSASPDELFAHFPRFQIPDDQAFAKAVCRAANSPTISASANAPELHECARVD